MTIITKVASLTITASSTAELQKEIGHKIQKVSNKPKWGGKFAFEIEKTENSLEAKLVIYYKYDNSYVENAHCEICKETHSLFYCNQQYNCARCEYKAYLGRAQEKEREMKSAGKEVLRK